MVLVYMPAIPRKSAALILVRERGPQGLEVFLLRRSLKSSFMAGNYVFPGGVVEKEDEDPRISSFCPPVDTGKEALSSRIAAIRELFEEAGILLARGPTGATVDLEGDAVKDRFRGYRKMLQSRGMTLPGLAEKEGLQLSPDELHHFAHWTTPTARPLRFDTHFFLCLCPDSQEAEADEVETTAGVWISPIDALRSNMEGRLFLSPPTLKIIEDLTPFPTVAQLRAATTGRDVNQVLSVYVESEGTSFVVFPWDADFGRFEKGDVPGHLDHGRLSQPGDKTTRVIQKKGRSIAYCKD
jgi:8-oxo-dGTP pyrophosphatase MutT (NUDIX family)